MALPLAGERLTYDFAPDLRGGKTRARTRAEQIVTKRKESEAEGPHAGNAIVGHVLHGEVLPPKKRSSAVAAARPDSKLISTERQAQSAGPGSNKIAKVVGLTLEVATTAPVVMSGGFGTASAATWALDRAAG